MLSNLPFYSVTVLSRFNIFHAFGVCFLLFIIFGLLVIFNSLREQDPPDYF